MHGDLGHLSSTHSDERRQEAVHAVEQRHRAQGFGAERLERASGVADGLVVQPVAHAVGDAALQPLPPRVLPVHAIPRHCRSPAPRELGDEGGDVRRIVLEIGVERDDHASSGGAESGGERGRLPRPLGERHDVDLGVIAFQPLEHVERAVGRPIVHGDDLIAGNPLRLSLRFPVRQGTPDLPHQDRQVLTLVVHRDDERQLNRVGHT